MRLRSALVFALSAAAVWLVGCSTVPIPPTEAETVTASQVLQVLPVTTEAPATVTVIRDRAFVAGSVVSFFFGVNGTEVVQLRTGQKYTFQLNPGEVFLSVRTNALGGTNKPAQVQTFLRPSKHYVYRVGNDSNWTPMLERDLELSDR